MLWGRSITFVFVAVWVGAGAVWIILDWLGNPNRGAFRPTGERKPRDIRRRLASRSRRRAENDATIRATLRERYGRSSLRLIWNEQREERALEADARLVRDPLRATRRPQPELPYGPLLLEADFGETPNLRESEAAPGPDFDPRSIRGWKVGVHPLALTRSGGTPSKATVRSRVWKNLAATDPVDSEQHTRMRAGKPPRRVNEPKGKVETARVDLATCQPYWPGETPETFTVQHVEPAG